MLLLSLQGFSGYKADTAYRALDYSFTQALATRHQMAIVLFQGPYVFQH